MSKIKKHKKVKKMVITSEQLLLMEKQVRRQLLIEEGSLHFKGGVEKSKKTYNRKHKRKVKISID